MSRLVRFLSRPTRVAIGAASAGLVFFVFAASIASCATANEQGAPEGDADPSVVPDAGEAGASAFHDGAAGDADRAPLDCDETAWCPVEAPLDPRYALRAVWGSAANDVWAVGSAGTVLHFDGARWVATPVDTTRTLAAVGGSSKDDVWVAGSTSAVFRSSGFVNGPVTWTDVSLQAYSATPFEGMLAALWARSPDDVWISGKCFRVASLGGNATRWRGRRVDGSDAGGAGSGVAWRTSGPCPDSLETIAALWGTSTTLWAVGTSADVFRTTDPSPADGSAPVWTELDSQARHDLTGVWGSSDDDVWVVGRGGTIRHYTGKPILEYVKAPTVKGLNAIWGASKDDIWAVGDEGTILHFDGTSWAPSSATFEYGTPNLYGVWGSAPDDVWAVGEGVIVHLGRALPEQPKGGVQ